MADPCILCPRQCRIHRLDDALGYCGIGKQAKVSSAGPHYGEEPVLVGDGGSGTIFFAGCNLGCVFCQNFDISHQHQGQPVRVEQVAQTMLNLQAMGCVNVNVVTPTHVVHLMAAAIELARQQGLSVPIVYNCGGYESIDVLKRLEGFVDIYMPDMKYGDAQTAQDLSDVPDYPQRCFTAIKEMFRQVGNLQVEDGVAQRGLLVRHLVLPDDLAHSRYIIDFLAQEISAHTAINVMGQYRPCYQAHTKPSLNRKPRPAEVEAVRQYALTKGLYPLS